MPYPSLENKVINDGTNPVVNVVNGSPQYYIKSMNARYRVDVDHKTTYTDRAFTYKTVKKWSMAADVWHYDSYTWKRGEN